MISIFFNMDLAIPSQLFYCYNPTMQWLLPTTSAPQNAADFHTPKDDDEVSSRGLLVVLAVLADPATLSLVNHLHHGVMNSASAPCRDLEILDQRGVLLVQLVVEVFSELSHLLLDPREPGLKLGEACLERILEV